jgi:hypothetical protein
MPGMRFNHVIAVDVFQSHSHPEVSLLKLGKYLEAEGVMYATCTNVAYFPVRLMLLLGFFNVGRKGILCNQNKRLFTLGSFKRLLKQGGYDILSVHGFSFPINEPISNSFPFKAINGISSLMAKIWISLFASHILIIAKKRLGIDELLWQTTNIRYK